jgi:hypothetical protein
MSCSVGARWERMDRRGKKPTWVETLPPAWVVSAVDARGCCPSGIRPLTGITICPVMRADGTILVAPGCDKLTGLWLDPRVPTVQVATAPDKSAPKAAAEALLELVCDFPLEPGYRSAWLAAALTPFARPATSGACPLVLIDGNIRGAGKTLLADVIGALATGDTIPHGPWAPKDAEIEKRITTVALEGDPLYLFDNVPGLMQSAALDCALTSVRWKGRVLGESTSVGALLNTVWLATGVNVALGGDLVRRVLHVRLESPDEHPEKRTGFRFPSLLEHVRERRARYVEAALTVLRGWHCAGRPDGKADWGSYESWSEIIRGAMTWLGYADPADTRTELAEAATEDGAFTVVLANWPKGGTGTPSKRPPPRSARGTARALTTTATGSAASISSAR